MKRYIPYIIPFVLFVIAIIVYFPATRFLFLSNWDDGMYIVHNQDVWHVSGSNFVAWFTKFYLSNYHPLTMLSFAFDFTLSGGDPYLFHIHNIVLHVFNAFLVYFISRSLFENRFIALFSLAVFALHPMHIESVVWVSERKDVLYTFWYLLGLGLYIRSWFKKNWINYTIVFICYLLSLLSKSAAVVFPLSLLLIDYYKGRLNRRLVISKIPFFILAVGFGSIALWSQKNAISDISPVYSFIERLVIANYNLWFYVYKFFIPFPQSAIYYLPTSLTWLHYLPLLLTVLLVYLFLKFRVYLKTQIFSILFFIVNLILVLQLISVGGAHASDRYTYVAYIGFSWGFASVLTLVFKKKAILVLFFIVSVGVMVFATYQRLPVWKDNISLFSDVAVKYPEEAHACMTLGSAYMDEKNWDESYTWLTKAIEINPDYAVAYTNRGQLFKLTGNYPLALSDFDRAIQLDPNALNFSNRGAVLYTLGKKSKAIDDFNEALKLHPEMENTRFNRAITLMSTGKNLEAIEDLTVLVESDPRNADYRFNLGLAQYQAGEYNLAVSTFSKTLDVNPDRADALLYRGNSYAQMRQFDLAKTDFSKAIVLKPTFADAWLYRGNVNAIMGNGQAACLDWQQAYKLGNKRAELALKENCK